MNDENVQGEGNAQPSTENMEGSAASQPAGQGVQHRIDELTALMREGQRQNAAQAQMIATLQTQVQQYQNQLAAPPEKPEEFDYSQLGEAGEVVRRAVDSAVKRTTDNLTRQFGEQYARLEGNWQSQQVRNLAAQYGLPPDVQAQCDAVLQGGRQRGIPLTPEDVVKWAAGEALLAGKLQPQLARGPKPSPYGAALTVGGAPMPVTPQVRSVAMPSNFENLTPEAQQAWLAKHGLDDMPLD